MSPQRGSPRWGTVPATVPGWLGFVWVPAATWLSPAGVGQAERTAALAHAAAIIELQH